MLDRNGALTLEALCSLAGVPCAAFGEWVLRPVVLRDGGDAPWLTVEPGAWGVVHVGIPNARRTVEARAQWALGALAYVLFDGVARASIAGAAWARVEQPRGAKRHGRRAMTSAERQRRFRANLRGVAGASRATASLTT
jgi:hypothetical protein